MNQEQFKELLQKYQEGRCSAEERKQLDAFFDAYTEPGSWTEWPEANQQQFEGELLADIKHSIREKEKYLQKKNSYGWLKVAASVVLVVSLGILAMLDPLHMFEEQVKLVTHRTEAGQKSTLQLSDGSTVILNAGSTLAFPEQFAEAHRKVVLHGEAFFEVTEDSESPFQVQSYGLQTTVLGTSFNLQAYDSLQITVALVTGKVKVQSLKNTDTDQAPKVLSPAEKATYNGLARTITVSPFDYMETVAWKDGILYFEGASHQQVFDQLGHWYGVTFQFENQPALPWNYSGEFEQMNLELVLNTIGFSEGFEYRMEDKVIYVEFKN